MFAYKGLTNIPSGQMQLWLLCIDKDIFANNSIMKVKLKILECVHVNHSFLMLYLLVFNRV